jgi:CO dehydrogenase nickel-insertion accessory protein CooC1
MKEFHCVLGNKGGVGKSLVASWLLQHATTAGYDVLGM